MNLPGPREMAEALFGAWRLAHLDRGGLQWFGDDVDAFWKSFFAAVLVAPGYAILVALQLWNQEVGADLFALVAIEALAYALLWLAFPLVMFHLCEAMGRGPRYLRFIVAFNWIEVIQMLVYLPVAALLASGWLPQQFAGPIYWLTLGALLFYEWFTARHALEVTAGAAVGVVLLDLLLDLLISALARSAIG